MLPFLRKTNSSRFRQCLVLLMGSMFAFPVTFSSYLYLVVHYPQLWKGIHIQLCEKEFTFTHLENPLFEDRNRFGCLTNDLQSGKWVKPSWFTWRLSWYPFGLVGRMGVWIPCSGCPVPNQLSGTRMWCQEILEESCRVLFWPPKFYMNLLRKVISRLGARSLIKPISVSPF